MSLYFPQNANKSIVEQNDIGTYTHKNAVSDQLKFAFQLPRNYEKISSNYQLPNINNPVVESVFFTSPTKDIQIIVQCTYLQYEVSLENYYLYLLPKSNETLLESRRINNDNDKPDLLVQRSFPDGQTWVTRRTGYKIWIGDGALVITLNVATNADNYIKHADLMYIIASSLQPTVPTEWPLAERLLMVSRRFPVDFATYIPYSWHEYHHHGDTTEEMNLVYTKNLRNKMTGMLSICCIAEHKVGGREAMLSKCHDGYKKQGFDLSNLKIEKSDDFLQFTNVIKGQVDIQKETKPQKQTKDNITFYLAKKGNNWVYMEMFGPAKTSDFEAWALNDRALEIIKDKMITI